MCAKCPCKCTASKADPKCKCSCAACKKVRKK